MTDSGAALVIGTTGFLGRHVARELHEQGWRVAGIGTRPAENAPLEVLKTYHALTLPSESLGPLVRAIDPSVCVHCAGRASVDLSLTEPAADFGAAAGVTAGVLEALRVHAPACRLVYVSSAAVYGQPAELPVTESQDLRPMSPYGHHRVIAEQLCREYAEVYGLAVNSARVFSAYGPGLRRQLLWDICRRALTEPELVLRGTGDESRDFIHGHDVARALVRIVTAGSGAGEAINVASGQERTVREVAAMALERLDSGVGLRFDGNVHAGNPTNWRADVTTLRELGFETEVPFEAGVAAYASWCRAELRGW
jgi:UDP-glucose 4-epimerase